MLKGNQRRGDIQGKRAIRYEIGNLCETINQYSGEMEARSREKKRTSDTQINLIVHSSNDDTDDDCDKVVHELNSEEDQCQLSEES